MSLSATRNMKVAKGATDHSARLYYFFVENTQQITYRILTTIEPLSAVRVCFKVMYKKEYYFNLLGDSKMTVK